MSQVLNTGLAKIAFFDISEEFLFFQNLQHPIEMELVFLKCVTVNKDIIEENQDEFL